MYGDSLDEKLDEMERLGIGGLEPSGTRLYERIEEIESALKGRSVKISAVCSGFNGFMLSTDQKVYNEFIASYKRIIEAAGALGSIGVIMVPGFNFQQPARPHTQETRDFMVEELRMLGEFAASHNTSVILEPLMHKESFFLRQVGDAARICRDVASPGVKCMGDFWHMTWEEANDDGALISARNHLAHIHIASRRQRDLPSVDGDADNYIDGFAALKRLNYQGEISFECYTKTDKRPTLPNAIALIKKQWEKAQP